MRPATRDKYRKLAELDVRSIVDEYDVLADAELCRRGIDPETLEPVPAAGNDEIRPAPPTSA